MAKIQIKLDEGSTTKFLTTPTGYSITSEEFTEVDDNDVHIQNFLLNRDDIIMKGVKINEGEVKDSIKDEVENDEKIFIESDKQ